MRKLVGLLAIVSAIGGVTAAVAFGSASTAATKTVTVGDNFFGTKSLRVTRGTIVRWSWKNTENPHNIAGKGFKSATKASGTYSHRFTKYGKFTVICQVHPTQMRMTVNVPRPN